MEIEEIRDYESEDSSAAVNSDFSDESEYQKQFQIGDESHKSFDILLGSTFVKTILFYFFKF